MNNCSDVSPASLDGHLRLLSKLSQKPSGWNHNISGSHLLLTFLGSRRSCTKLIYPQTPISQRTLHALQNGALQKIETLFSGCFFIIDASAPRFSPPIIGTNEKGAQTVRLPSHTVRIEVCNILTCGLSYPLNKFVVGFQKLTGKLTRGRKSAGHRECDLTAVRSAEQ